MKLFHRKHDEIEARRLSEEILTVKRVMARYDDPRPLAFGAPTRCPDCGEFGLVDEVRGPAAFNHCYLCGTEWVLTVRALRAVASAERDDHDRPVGVPQPAGDGILFDQPAPTRSAAPRMHLAFSTAPRVQIIGA